MQNKQDVANAIFDSIDIIVNQKLSKLAFNTTIIGRVNKRHSNTDYEVIYQDRKIRAISLGPIYEEDNMVYVMIPNNKSDYSAFILGVIDTTNFIREVEQLKVQQLQLIAALRASLEGNNEEAINIIQEIGGDI